MLMISELSKTYRGGTQALAAVSLEIDRGMFGLLGPNGAGKTTLMRTLATLLRPDNGTARLGGVDIIRTPAAARPLLGYLPQEFGTYPSLTVREYLDYLGLLSGLPAAPRARRIEELLKAVNLTDQRDQPTRRLSGGMRRRLGIAQALLSDPQLLIVDEPTAGLDPEERVRFRNLLADLGADRVVLLSTHIVEDVAHTCARLAVINRGRIIFCGSPADLIARAEGRVWTLTTDETQAAHLRRHGRVTLLVRTGHGLALRLVTPDRPPGATAAEPTLEDAYLDLIGGESA